MIIKREIDVLNKLRSIESDLRWARECSDQQLRIKYFQEGRIKLDLLIELMEQGEQK